MKQISLYKPNRWNSGSAASFTLKLSKSTDKHEVFINIVNQVSWDDKTKTGSFKSDDPDNKIAVKFTIIELAAIVRAIRDIEPFSTVHQFDGVASSISMKMYSKKPEDPKKFNIFISRNGKKYSINLDSNEAFVLVRFCEDAIIHLMYTGDRVHEK